MSSTEAINLISLGAHFIVQPLYDIQACYSEKCSDRSDDRKAFFFRSNGYLMDRARIVGIYGRVTESDGRFDGLFCSAIIRVDEPGWILRSTSLAMVIVSPTVVGRNPKYDIRHPDGTRRYGFPYFATGGRVSVAQTIEDKHENRGIESGQAFWIVDLSVYPD